MCDLVGYLQELLQRQGRAAMEQSSRRTMDRAIVEQAVPAWMTCRARTSMTEPTKAL